MSPERYLWSLYEPVHAIVYFEPRVAGCLADHGLHGFWNGYFAGRAAPLGAVGPDPVRALFFGFAPTMVAAALPKVWSRITPEQAVAARVDAAERVLAPLLEPGDDVRRAVDLLVEAAGEASTDGRALAAAWQGVAVPDEPAARLWWAVTVLREHRGDGHVLAATAAGLSGLQAGVTHVATGRVTRASLQPHRGWTDEEWDDAVAGLAERGLVLDDGSALTAAGHDLREAVEAETDRLARPATAHLEHDPGVRALLEPLGRAIAAAGALPAANPRGVPVPEAGA